MEREILIRHAVQEDLTALTEIYNYYVINSIATFDIETFSVEQRQGWIDQFSTTGPYQLFVAEQGGKAVGYAGSTRFRPKPAYNESVETTIYLSPEHAGSGVGSKLYAALFDALASESVHRAYAGLAMPNDGSRAIHLKFGFEPRYTLSEVGRKFDRYIDVEWFEKKLDQGSVS